MMTRSLGVSVLLILGASVAAAGTIAVVNSSFEDPPLLKGASTVDAIPGWTTANFGAAGVFHPGVAQFPGGAPDGTNTAYSDGDVISQALGETLQSGVVYTLRVDVGARLDTSYSGGAIELAAGGVALRSVPADSVPLGGFATITLTFNALASHPSVGQQLEVRLTGFGPQINFDNVRLDTEPFVAQSRLVPSQYATIQAAIEACVDGDEVVVAPGTYTESLNTLGKAITLRSSDGASATILDGMSAGPFLTMTSSEGRETIVRGFTFTNCSSESIGGAISLFESSPTILDCVFTSNSASAGGAIGGYASPLISGCSFSGNVAAEEGGAIRLSGPFSSRTLTVSNCTFTDNSAGLGLGGAASLDGASVAVESCTFDSNSGGGFGIGGGLFLLALDGTISRCVFTGNTAYFGGGLFAGAPFFLADRPAPRWFADRGGGPGPSFVLRIEVDTCVFQGNTGVFGGGAAFLCGSSKFLTTAFDAAVRNSLFVGNQSVEINASSADGFGAVGGGLAIGEFGGQSDGPLLPSRFVIGASTIVQNSAADAGGGAFHFGPSPLRLIGSVAWGNSDPNGFSESSQFTRAISDSADRSCIQNLATIPGVGSTGLDPLFLDELGPDLTPGTGDEDFRPGPLSPCIDAGDASGVTATTAFDISGSARAADDPAALNSGVPIAGIGWIDMGAFERQIAPVVPCLGDENEDGVVDFFDLNNVLGGFGNPCPPGPPR